MLQDRRLIQKLKRGDGDALRVIYEKYRTELVTIAASLLREGSEAEDVLHDVFISFASGIMNFQLHGNLKRYLATCVINRVRDRARRKTFEVIEIDRLRQVGSGSPPPEQSVILNERTQMLVETLGRIPYEQREVIVLHLKGGMKFREIAVVQGVSISTVQGRYRYGLDKMRSVLNEEAVR